MAGRHFDVECGWLTSRNALSIPAVAQNEVECHVELKTLNILTDRTDWLSCPLRAKIRFH